MGRSCKNLEVSYDFVYQFVPIPYCSVINITKIYLHTYLRLKNVCESNRNEKTKSTSFLSISNTIIAFFNQLKHYRIYDLKLEMRL